MAIAGGLGVNVSLNDVPRDGDVTHDAVILFSESPTRFVLEVRPADLAEVAGIFGALPLGRLGEVDGTRLIVNGLEKPAVIDVPVDDLKAAWQKPLRW
jgi:phosphoribosylformylglycinamidine synthase